MTPEQFVYWLQGYVEISGEPPSEEQWEMIKEHLSLVFDKQTSTPIWPDINKEWEKPPYYHFQWDYQPKVIC